MSERLEPQAYLEELKNLRVAITEAASRAEALDQEEKPTVLALARVGGISLDALMFHLERAEEQAADAVYRTELLLADLLD